MWRPEGWLKIRGQWFDRHYRANGGEREDYEGGADAMLEALKAEVVKHPIFWKNCRSNQKRLCKICRDCPFRQAGIIPNEENNNGN